ncbi:hypothetical protein MtrunA17_Chr8g0352761 [Medicago truncatula]|uniref:Uncharacterized protein n=1 Tax=Medicago truncatula TaxID=3880 RepID=Q1RU66_MEDTR|nr:hypothetical protein MtrDRAFT_AC153125g3v2 [Medicago truncatula]AET02275.1 hypothetical protein MTR_8g038430 [Medicago truncatula]RHN40254.1 hypothetical protein MtrunA17_Chr8g0352761 [Medicago truncatula]
MAASIGESGNSSGKTVSRFRTGKSRHSANPTSESVCIDQMTSESVPSTSFPIRDRYKKPQKKIGFASFWTFSKYESKKESVKLIYSCSI